MPTQLLLGLFLFTLALLLYTIATWAGVKSGALKKWHLFLFWGGLVADISGTVVIAVMAGGFVMNIHSILVTIALIAMTINNIMATKALQSKDENQIASFPKKVSIPVWVIWMASYVAGLMLSGGSH